MIVTLSRGPKNSIPAPCEYEEPLNLDQISWFAIQLIRSVPETLTRFERVLVLSETSVCHNPVSDVNIVQIGQLQLLHSK